MIKLDDKRLVQQQLCSSTPANDRVNAPYRHPTSDDDVAARGVMLPRCRIIASQRPQQQQPFPGV